MNEKYQLINVDDISDVFISRNRDEQDFKRLVESIKNLGLIIPITVRRKLNKFEVIKGQGRLTAHKELGLRNIKAYVIEEISDDDKVRNWLVENVVRQHLSPYDKRRMMKFEYDKLGNIEDVARLFGVSKYEVKEAVDFFNNASESIKEKIENKELRFTPAKKIVSSIKDKQTQDAVAEIMIKEKLDVKSENVLISRAANLEQKKQKNDKIDKKITVSDLRRDIRFLREDAQNKKDLLSSYQSIWELGKVGVDKLARNKDFVSLLEKNGLEILKEDV